MFYSLSNSLISFLNNSNYNNIDKYVSLGISYNPSNDFKCLLYFINAIAQKNNKEYKEAINNYNNTITISKNLNDDECEKLFKKNKEDTIDLFYNHLFAVIYEMIIYSNEGNYEEFNKIYENEIKKIDSDEKRDKLIFLCVNKDISNELFLKGYNKLFGIKEQENNEFYLNKAFCLLFYIKSYFKDNNDDEDEQLNIDKVNELENYYNILINIPHEDPYLKILINNLKIPLFIKKGKALIKLEKYEEVLKNIENILNTSLNENERNEIENFKKETEKKYYDYLYEKGDIQNFLQKNNQNKNLMNSISNALSNYADDDIENGDLDKAQENIQKAIELNPENPQLYNNSAFINLQKGDFENALEDINNAL